MRVFVTGATGFIGSAIVEKLIGAGHQVLGLARSCSAARSLTEAGAGIHWGNLEDLESLRAGAAAADAVIHTGFSHDFFKFKAVCEADRLAIEALGSALVGSDRPLIVTSGTMLVRPGQFATENMFPALTSDLNARVATEEAANAVASMGVNVSVVRLSPSVHGEGDYGFIPMLIGIAREKGVSGYIGEGNNRWTAVHRLDAADLYCLALEKAKPGARFHGVAEEAITFRAIAEVIGKHLNLPAVSISPDDAASHFSWLARFASLDCPASGELTGEILGWIPIQPKLFDDLISGDYFKV